MLDPTTPVRPTSDISVLLDGMSKTGFQGRKLGESVAVWRQMIKDPKAQILLGISGAMIPAGMQECFIELVERGFVDAIVSTGANIFHDICEHCGIRHYIGHHHVDDAALFEKRIDRIYDVFAYEDEFRRMDTIIAEYAAGIRSFEGSSAAFLKGLGEWLIREHPKSRSLIASCTNHGIPIFIPAISDSSIGIGLLIARRKGIRILIDQIADADEVTALVERSERTGVIYIGGGVPKNFIQQTQVVGSIHENGCGGHDYAIQFTTDTPHFGGLSGCTFEEAISWGKEACNCQKVQCFCDATIALPLVVSALVSSGTVRAKRSG